MIDKARLRAQVRRSRARDSAAVVAQRAHDLMAFRDEVAVVSGPGIAGFQPTNDEPDIGPLLLALPTPVYLPRVTAERQLEWVAARTADLRGTRSGIPVPAGPAVAVGAGVADLPVGAILVPALAVDPATGDRLGYGAGYYDRLLARLPAGLPLIGVCRDLDLLAVPVEPHDVPVTAVLTESGLRWL